MDPAWRWKTQSQSNTTLEPASWSLHLRRLLRASADGCSISGILETRAYVWLKRYGLYSVKERFTDEKVIVLWCFWKNAICYHPCTHTDLSKKNDLKALLARVKPIRFRTLLSLANFLWFLSVCKISVSGSKLFVLLISVFTALHC